MYFLLIISALLTVAAAQQSISCFYWIYGDTYVCDLSLINPNGFNDFTQIGGIHLEGFTNANVDFVHIDDNSVSTNVPSIICNTFPNSLRLDLYDIGLTEISDSSFAGCSIVEELFLEYNSIRSISTNAFVNLPNILYFQLDINLLTTLPENVFASQRNLTFLSMSRNNFQDIPAGVFRPLENLASLQITNANLSAINNQWFSSNTRLSVLYLSGNRIDASASNFVGLESVVTLNLAQNGINEIEAGAFARLPNLRYLILYGNNLTELQANSFPDLGPLNDLDISSNPINVIDDGAFRGLGNVTRLDISSGRILQLSSNVFEGLENLETLYLNFNEIEELSPGVFVPLPNLKTLNLWNNRLKSLNRNTFGALTNLQTLDLSGNVMNALDRAIIDEALNLNTLLFESNLCASNYFGNFQLSRPQHLAILERCFVNFRYIIETITEVGDEFSFFGPDTGIALRVNTDNEFEVQIALTPFSFLWSPMIEIFIGTTNNTRSSIRVNQETNVVTVPTPNIITRNQLNDFRVTWANQLILVFSGNDTFPFMGFSMQDFFPVNFYGLRAVDTRASWTVQPFDW